MIETLILGVITFFCTYAIFTISLNFQQGYTGIFNLGLYFPIIAGALIVGFLPGRLAMQIYGIDSNLDYVTCNAEVLELLRARLRSDPLTSFLLLIITLIVVVSVCLFLGYVSAYPALKLPPDYLALFMLSLAESLRVIGMQTSWVAGGVMGIMVIDPFWWLGYNAYLGSSVFVVCSTAIIFIIYHRMCSSPLGRLLKGIRENELTAECVGKDVSLIKKKVMIFSFATLGVGGALQAFHMGAVVSGGYTRVDFSFWPWLMMIVGGTGNNLGVLLGTFILVIMRRIMIVSKHYFTFLPFDVIWLEPILLAIMLMFTLIFRSAGILPEKPSRVKKVYAEVKPSAQSNLQS